MTPIQLKEKGVDGARIRRISYNITGSQLKFERG